MELTENVMQEIVKLQYFVGNFSERLPFWVERITITIMLNLLWKIACYGFNEVFDVFDIEIKNSRTICEKARAKISDKMEKNREREREKVRMKKSMWKMTTTAVAAITNTASKNNWHNARRECSTENGKVNDTKMLSIMHTRAHTYY